VGGSSRGGAGVGLLLARAYGYEWVPETGLYHVGARAYDPRTARWLQRDPIDAASGDPNLYRYCGNDPINTYDPYGSFSVSVAIAGALLGFGIGGEIALGRCNRPDRFGQARLGRPARATDPRNVQRHGWARSFHIDRHPLPPRLDPSGSRLPITHINADIGLLSRINQGHIIVPDWVYPIGNTRTLRVISRGATGLGILMDAYTVYTATPEDRGRAIGGAVGGAIGSAIGAAIGSAILPGLGTWVGSTIGGIAGGVLGEWIGSRF